MKISSSTDLIANQVLLAALKASKNIPDESALVITLENVLIVRTQTSPET